MDQHDDKKKKANKVMPVILGAVLLAGAAVGITAFIRNQAVETTDNAQIDGNVTPITARASGLLKAIRFSDNQYVRRGDTLFLIEDDDYQIKLAQAQAALTAAKLNADISCESALSSKANVSTAENTIIAARVRLNKAVEDFERYKTLMQNEATTQEKLDAAKAEKDAAEAQMAVLGSQLTGVSKMTSVALKQVDAASVAIRQKSADVDFARLQLSYTVVRAPSSGIVSKRGVQTGQLIQPGTPMCAIVDIDSMFVTANFKETQVKRLKLGAKVSVEVDAFPDKPLTGTIASFSGATGAKFSLLQPDNATGNFVKVVQRVPVKIALESHPGAGLIRPGMSVEAKVRVK